VNNWFDSDDEKQEYELGRIVWLKKHPNAKRNDTDLMGYWRRGYYRKQQARWMSLRTTMVEQIMKTDIGLDFETMLLREILEMLPMSAKRSVLRALLSTDGRRIIKAGRIVREKLPEVVKKVGREILV